MVLSALLSAERAQESAWRNDQIILSAKVSAARISSASIAMLAARGNTPCISG